MFEQVEMKKAFTNHLNEIKAETLNDDLQFYPLAFPATEIECRHYSPAEKHSEDFRRVRESEER
jgi:hypothetical protein